MAHKFDSKPYHAVFGCLCFTALGLFLFFQPGLISKSIGLLCLLFFGPGACVLLWRACRRKIASPPARSPCAFTAQQIRVEQQEVQDNELLEYWARVGNRLNQSFQGVSASKSTSVEYAWSLSVSAGEFFREGRVAEQFDNEIHAALCRVPGARTVAREDREQWAIDGDCSGEALVVAASLANDRVLSQYEAGQCRQHS